MPLMDLGRVGIWSGVLRRGDPAEAADAAAELDELGFGAVWIPGGAGGDVLGDSRRLLDATTHAVVATGILNVWMHEPQDVARGHAALTTDHPGRFLLGLGVSHAPAVERANQQYVKPFSKMVDYLDQLDAASPPVPHEEEVLAALGPRMLSLAAERTAGAHPYFVPPEHTAIARQTLGDGPLLATEQMVVLDTDPGSARSTARENIARVPRSAELHEQPAHARLHRRRPRTSPAATDSSTPSLRGATRARSPSASMRITTRAPITCACRCCSLIPPRSPAPNGARSPLRSSPRTDPRETPPMRYTHLGRTGLSVSRICLGTMNFGPQTDEADSDLIMDRAIDEGINFFDTANVYGFGDRKGWTEEIVGRWFAQGGGRREKTVIATKLYGSMSDWPNDTFLSARNIRFACEASLRRLQTDYIDLYQMHHVDRKTPWDEIWQAMDTLVQQGKVLYVGSSNFAGWHLVKAQEAANRRHFTGLASEQSLYNLMERTVELEVLPAALDYGIGILPWSPVHGGLLGGILRKQDLGRSKGGRAAAGVEKHRDRIEKYEALCDDLGHEPADVAVAWLLHQPAVTAPIVGPRTMAHLEGGLAVARHHARCRRAATPRRAVPRPGRHSARGLRLVAPSCDSASTRSRAHRALPATSSKRCETGSVSASTWSS